MLGIQELLIVLGMLVASIPQLVVGSPFSFLLKLFILGGTAVFRF